MIFLNGSAASGGVYVNGSETRGVHFHGSPVFAKLYVRINARRTNAWLKYNFDWEVSEYNAPFTFVSRVTTNVSGYWGGFGANGYTVTGTHYYNFTHESGGNDTLRMRITGVTMPYYSPGSVSYSGSWVPLEEGWGSGAAAWVVC